MCPLGHQHSTAQRWNGSRWKVLDLVPGAGLAEVSCTSATFCMAVGSVIDSWTGHTWERLQSEKGQSLSGVACTSTTFCVAVGTSVGDMGNVSEAWNGTTWRSLTTPQNGCVPLCGLSKVACPSATRCVAVGGTASNSGLSDFSSGMAWNGKSWRDTPTPRPDVSSSLSGVSCTGKSSCLAVGNYTSESPACNCILAAGWNGSTWQQVSTPSITGGLSAVSCPAVHACVAVGGGLAVSWDGSTRTQQTIATPGEKSTGLSDVACWSASACMAVGSYTEASGAQLTLAETWNGSAWTVVRTRSPADPFAGLSGVSCFTPTSCIAVGARVGGSDGYQTLAERWGGRHWRVLATPSPGAQVSVLSAVSCTRSSDCVAVGWYDAAGSPQTLAERWDGVSWKVLSTAHPGTLSAVSCPQPSACVAVGSYFAAGIRLSLAESWNGSSWQVQSTTDPGGTFNQLTGVFCNSTAFCAAVGSYDISGRLHPLTEMWNGSSWQTQANPGGARQLGAVWCRQPFRCLAVGSTLAARHPQPPAAATAMTWNGAAWAVSRTLTPRKSVSAHLGAVSCPDAGCQAVGGYAIPSGSVFPLSEGWNGTRWELRGIAAPSPSYNDLFGISCPALGRCIAVGGTGAQETLAERWNGTRWRLMKTLNP